MTTVREYLENAPPRGPSCFPAPLLDDGMFAPPNGRGIKTYRVFDDAEAAGGLPHDRDLDWLAETDPPAELAKLGEAGQLALARLIPSLLCGEESAVIIFNHESRRFGRQAREHISRSLTAIAHEEEQHEVLLNFLTDFLPDAEDLDEIKKRARGFFMKLGFSSNDATDRLNLIGALDRCVCITLGAMMKRSTLRNSPVFSRVVERIRKDEARHVKICRGVMAHLGITKAHQREADDIVRQLYVELMTPVGDAFDAIEIDPDNLFGRILREPGI